MFAVLRFQKLKSRQEISAMYIHWRRDQDTPNADPNRKIEFLLGTCAKEDLIWRLPAKHRSNAVLAVEGVLSASPTYFRPDDPTKAGQFDPERTAAWVARSLTWLQAEFGDRLVSVVHHMDEATPHLHFAVVPLRADGTLCAREMFNPEGLRRMQTEYARELVPLGIRRGREGSPAEHTQVARFYEDTRKSNAPVALSTIEMIAMKLFDRTPRALAELQARALDGDRARDENHHLRDEAAHAARAADEVKRERQALQNRLRALPLTDVLPKLSYRRVSKGDVDWIGPVGRLTVKAGADGKPEAFRLHEVGKSGRGAIDLVMMTEGLDFAGALAWLSMGRTRAEVVAASAACAEDQAQAALDAVTARGGPELVPTSEDPLDVAVIADRLVTERRLPETLIRSLVDNRDILAGRFGSGTINAAYPLSSGDKVGQPRDLVGVRIESTRPGDSYWGQRGGRGVWTFSYPGPAPSGREVVVLGQSPTSVLSVCALAERQQGLIPALERGDIGQIVFVAAEGAATDEVRGIVRAAAARGAEVVTAFDPDERGRRLGNLVREEVQATPAARVTGVSGLVTLAGEHLNGFWALWLLLLAEGAEILRERIAKARAAGPRRRGSGPGGPGTPGSGGRDDL